MKRREFITGLALAVMWPTVASAQQSERMRRIGVFFAGAADANDADTRSRLAAFQHGLQQLGWSDGRNIQIDYRWGGGNAALIRRYAEELVALSPDVHLQQWRRHSRAIAASNSHGPDRFRWCRRSSRCWLC